MIFSLYTGPDLGILKPLGKIKVVTSYADKDKWFNLFFEVLYFAHKINFLQWKCVKKKKKKSKLSNNGGDR